MKQQMTYLDRLARAARWQLPPGEAAEVVADYADLLAGDNRPEAVLRREVGTPWRAVRLVRPAKSYGRWLAIFALLTACLALPLLRIFSGYGPFLRGPWWDRFTFGLFCLGAGLGLSLFWFERQGRREDAKLPGSLYLCIAALLVLLAGVWGLACPIFSPALLARLAGLGSDVGPVFHVALKLIGLLAALTGLLGAVRARLADRRWRAVYVLGLTVVLVALLYYSLLTGMDLSASFPGWERPFALRMALLTLAGLAGTGVSLC